MLGFITAYAEEAATTAETAAQATAQDGGVLGLLVSLLPMVLIIVLLYWMMIRPQRKQQKQQQEMRAALKVGDKVVTIGGICGKVSKIKDDYVYIETSMPGAPDQKSYIKFKKNAIETVEKQVEE